LVHCVYFQEIDRMKNEMKPHWPLDEFKTYLLLYAAHADFLETEEEKEAILSRCNPEQYKRIQREFNLDNDYQQIEKIIVHLHSFKLSKTDVRQLLKEMTEVQMADRQPDILEKSMMMLLKRIFEQETAG
jgi:hypothetical protein